jgi:aspartyl-tRNA synthetase
MSFANPEIIYRLIEGMFERVFKTIGIGLPIPFPRMTYAEAMRRFGSDKPDLRFEMELTDLSDDLRTTDFAPFAATLEQKGEIKCLTVKNGANYSRKVLDELQEFVKRYGASALAWIKIGDEISSSLLKVLGQETIERLAKTANAEKGDAVLIVAGKKDTVAASLGALRVEIGKRENLINKSIFAPLWVTEFPMFEYHEDDDRFYAMHHPFTAPMDEDLETYRQAIESGDFAPLVNVRAKAYDVVVNGYELGGGSIRIHQAAVQSLNFKALGITPEKAKERFGFFVEALEYGTPPHGGIALGIERICMILCGTDNIRDVMAFPKTASATDLMIEAPGDVEAAQLEELRINIKE